MIITHELPAHAGAIEALLDTSFGPKRHAKTVYKLRRGVAPLADLSFIAMDGDGVVRGTIRFWPVMIAGKTPAVMLGPIAIDPAHRNGGLGARLIQRGLEAAAAAGHAICILVGDAPYYVRFGFDRGPAQALRLPGPVDPDRFLALELAPGALTGVTGLVGRAAPSRGSVRLDGVGTAAALPALKATATAARPSAPVAYTTTATGAAAAILGPKAPVPASGPAPAPARRRRIGR